jgi:hypothetical protein
LFPPPSPPKDFLFNTHKSMPSINTIAIRLAKMITKKFSFSFSLSQQIQFSYSTLKNLNYYKLKLPNKKISIMISL